MYNIIGNHIFQDGNKRTGLQAALLFLKLNGHSLKEKLSKVELENNTLLPQNGKSPQEILTEFTLEIASGKINLSQCQNWFQENVIAAK